MVLRDACRVAVSTVQIHLEWRVKLRPGEIPVHEKYTVILIECKLCLINVSLFYNLGICKTISKRNLRLFFWLSI